MKNLPLQITSPSSPNHYQPAFTKESQSCKDKLNHLNILQDKIFYSNKMMAQTTSNSSRISSSQLQKKNNLKAKESKLSASGQQPNTFSSKELVSISERSGSEYSKQTNLNFQLPKQSHPLINNWAMKKEANKADYLKNQEFIAKLEEKNPLRKISNISNSKSGESKERKNGKNKTECKLNIETEPIEVSQLYSFHKEEKKNTSSKKKILTNSRRPPSAQPQHQKQTPIRKALTPQQNQHINYNELLDNITQSLRKYKDQHSQQSAKKPNQFSSSKQPMTSNEIVQKRAESFKNDQFSEQIKASLHQVLKDKEITCSESAKKLLNKNQNTHSLTQFVTQVKQTVSEKANFVQNVVQKARPQSSQKAEKKREYYMSKMILFYQGFNPDSPLSQLYRDHFLQSFHALGREYLNLSFQDFVVFQSPYHRMLLTQKNLAYQENQHYVSSIQIQKIQSTKPQFWIQMKLQFIVMKILQSLLTQYYPLFSQMERQYKQRSNGAYDCQAGINIRPYAEQLLSQLTSLCEVIVFTASHQCYANPNNKLIHHHLFRDNCVTTEEGVHIKDLRVIGGRNLKDVVLVDNAAYSFGFQLNNGIPIIPYYDNKADTELYELLEYLKSLLQADDVREVNKRVFKMEKYSKFEEVNEAIHNILDI